MLEQYQMDDETRELIKEASSFLDGDPVEIEQTRDGKYIVLFMSFTSPPPPKGDTPKEALQKFIEKMKATKNESSDNKS